MELTPANVSRSYLLTCSVRFSDFSESAFHQCRRQTKLAIDQALEQWSQFVDQTSLLCMNEQTYGAHQRHTEPCCNRPTEFLVDQGYRLPLG